jgi:hypothetical protein
MAAITFTASIVRTGKGRYVAHADEFPVTANPATTQRGAVRNLKDAMLSYLRRAAHEGRLGDVVSDAGYGSGLIRLTRATLQCNHILDATAVILRLPYQPRRAMQTRGEFDSFLTSP